MKKVGLALGGGGARGCAHIGAIKALREANIPIDYVTGTSMGALVGGVFSAGDIDEFEKFLTKLKWSDVAKFLDLTLLQSGLFGGDKVCKLVKKSLIHQQFRKANIPYTVVATDLSTGKEVRISKGDIVTAIRASIAIPGVFTPEKKGQKYLIDGGVVNPLPINVARDMGADIVIAIDLNHNFLEEKGRRRSYGIGMKNKLFKWFQPSYPNILDVIENSVFVMQDQITEKNLLFDQSDILVRPMLSSAGLFDFHKAKKLIDEGYRAMKKKIPALKKLISD